MGGKTFDYKKEYKDLYMPKNSPTLVDVPPMAFIMVDGQGDPNGNPEFEKAVELLYGLSYGIKMSKMKGIQPEGYFDYVVPPLEGLWWVNDGIFSLVKRDNWVWTVMIRQPEFVNQDVFTWAQGQLNSKKPGLRVGKARLEVFTEGLCVQMLHLGPYADEPGTMARIDAFMNENKLKCAFSEGGKHHEIYLIDPRKGNPANMKTVLRHPVSRM